MIGLDWHIFKDNVSKVYSQKAVLYALEGMVNVNRLWLKMNPSTPLLYKAGVRYIREEGKREHWRDIPSIIKNGGGDCEDLACWRVAELRKSKVKCHVFLRWRKYGDFWLYHVLVQYENGRFEDPSKVLGMNGEG